MKKYQSAILLVMLLFMLMLLGVPAFAQDQPVNNLDAPTVLLSVGQIIIGAIAIFGAGGVISVAGVGLLAMRLRQDKTTIAAIEKLGDSVPPETAKHIMDLSGQFNKSVNEITLLVTEALDRIPAVEKPPAPTP